MAFVKDEDLKEIKWTASADMTDLADKVLKEYTAFSDDGPDRLVSPPAELSSDAFDLRDTHTKKLMIGLNLAQLAHHRLAELRSRLGDVPETLPPGGFPEGKRDSEAIDGFHIVPTLVYPIPFEAANEAGERRRKRLTTVFLALSFMLAPLFASIMLFRFHQDGSLDAFLWAFTGILLGISVSISAVAGLFKGGVRIVGLVGLAMIFLSLMLFSWPVR